MAELTPVERSVLVALMAAGGTLKENAELAGRYGLKMTASHRKTLSGLGLVKTTRSPFTHTLTDEGWAFLASEFPLDVPRDMVKLGGMNALVAGVQRACEANGLSLAGFFAGKAGKPAKTKAEKKAPEDAVAEAAWSESEEALAMALQDMTAFAARLERQARAAGDDQAQVFKQLSLNAENVLQSVRQAARKRDLDLAFEPGAEAGYDAAMFDCYEEMDDGEAALVVKQPVIKHTAPDQSIVVLRGLASPAD